MSIKIFHQLVRLPVQILFFCFLFLYSCEESPDKFTLGKEFIESQTDISLIDTFSVNLSTVILDTVYTSGKGNIIVGNYHDNILGKISSNSYFQIGIPESFDVLDDDTYDSLNLIIRYNKYSFGDTTNVQKISVYQLTERIKADDNGNINSKTTFNYNLVPIGSIIYTPKPNSSIDTLYIKINDNIGLDFFSKLRDNSSIVTNNESFIDYFHGIVLKEDDNFEGAIIGFNAYDAGLILYTTRVAEAAETINYEFMLEDSTKQFNNINHDFSSTQLNNLVNQRNELTASETSGLSYLQGGIGLVIRVDFPSLQEILLLDRGKITEATLSIAPSKNSYDDFELPTQLILYKSDKLNRINGYSYGSSTLTVDELYNEETSYTFDITYYLNEELSDFYVDPESGLIITLSSNNMAASFYRLIADAQKQKPKLKIYYLTY